MHPNDPKSTQANSNSGGSSEAVAPRVIRSITEARDWRAAQTGSVAVAPTMGALHQGHLDLIQRARECADKVVATIFVNPAQFGKNEDLDSYPRTFDEDLARCEEAGVDMIFAPSDISMYPFDYKTWVNVEEMGSILEGEQRPDHFRGVATVVLKLFNILRPNTAVFGWKDAQQFIMLRKMVEDLNFDIEMVGVEIAREEDGLALSSRNVNLSEKHRQEATALNRALKLAHDLVENGPVHESELIIDRMRRKIQSETSAKIDYIAVTSLKTLRPLERVEPGETLIAVAARFGDTRLLDNVRV